MSLFLNGWEEDSFAARVRKVREEQAERLRLAAASPIRARVDQADMADTPLFGQGNLL